MTQKPLICIVCFANYCRSPVIEAILKKKFECEYKFISAGIDPMIDSNMDPRSLKYLKSINIDAKYHLPTALTPEIVKNSEKIFAVDLYILSLLNKKYKRYRDKIFLFKHLTKSLDFSDPFKMNNEDYFQIMQNISEASNNLKI